MGKYEFTGKLCCLFEKKYQTRKEVNSHLSFLKNYGSITHGGPFECDRDICICDDCGAVFIRQDLEEFEGPCGYEYIEDSYYHELYQVNSLDDAYELCDKLNGMEIECLTLPEIVERDYKGKGKLSYFDGISETAVYKFER